MFEWDEGKRRANIAKHGIDFIVADLLFDGRPRLTFESSRDHEMRFGSVAILDGSFVTAIWTWRDDRRRIISIRNARDDETARYQALHGR